MNFSTKWNARVAVYWEKIRAKGKLKYVLLRWVFFWGIATAALFNIFASFFQTPLSVHPLISFILFPIAGIYVGILHWNTMDAGYRRYKSQQELEALGQLGFTS